VTAFSEVAAEFGVYRGRLAWRRLINRCGSRISLFWVHSLTVGRISGHETSVFLCGLILLLFGGWISSVWAYLCVAGRIYGSGTELFLCDLGYCCVGTISLLVGRHILTVDRVLSKRKALHWWLLSPSRFGWVDCWGQIYKGGAEFLCVEWVLCGKDCVVSVCGRFGCREVCFSLIYQTLHTNVILQVGLFIYNCCTLYLLHRQHIYLTHWTNLSPLFAVIVYVRDK
jgi:hypothetical protein